MINELRFNERDLKHVHQRLKESKRKRKDLKEIVKNELTSSKQYQELLEQITELKAKKARMEAQANDRLKTELEEIEKVTVSIKADQQLMSDIALSKFMKGETIELVDENDTKYEPVWKVTFKKT